MGRPACANSTVGPAAQRPGRRRRQRQITAGMPPSVDVVETRLRKDVCQHNRSGCESVAANGGGPPSGQEKKKKNNNQTSQQKETAKEFCSSTTASVSACSRIDPERADRRSTSKQASKRVVCKTLLARVDHDSRKCKHVSSLMCVRPFVRTSVRASVCQLSVETRRTVGTNERTNCWDDCTTCWNDAVVANCWDG